MRRKMRRMEVRELKRMELKFRGRLELQQKGGKSYWCIQKVIGVSPDIKFLHTTPPLASPPHEKVQGNSDSDLVFSDNSYSPIPIELDSDLDVPIAVRKGVRTCTQHPISNFVSYNHLSPSYRAFLSRISSVDRKSVV